MSWLCLQANLLSGALTSPWPEPAGLELAPSAYSWRLASGPILLTEASLCPWEPVALSLESHLLPENGAFPVSLAVGSAPLVLCHLRLLGV